MEDPTLTHSSSLDKFALKLSGFTVIGLSKTRTFIRTAKYYLRIKVGAANTTTAKVSVVDRSTTWKDEFFCDACSSDVLELSLYVHRLRKDKLVGELKECIDSLFQGQHDGVLKRNLIGCEDDIHPSEISFTFGIDTLGISALHHQTLEAVGQAQEQAAHMRDLPKSFQAANAMTGMASAAEARIVPAIDVLTPFMSKISKFNDIVKDIAEIHPYANMAWKILSMAYNVIIAQNLRDSRILDLLGVMNDVYGLILDAEPLRTIQTQKQALEVLAKQTTECAYFISHYAHEPSYWSRLGKNIMGSVDCKITDFEKAFQRLRATFQEGIALHTELFVLRMVSDIGTIAAEGCLNDMPYASGAGYIPEKQCMSATREEILQEIIDWINLPDGDDFQRICWLSGLAGTGKSAIAHTVAGRYKEIGRLGSSFFFDVSMKDERRISLLFSTVAVNIAGLDPEWKKSLWGVVKDQKELRTTSSIELQFKHFILEPARFLKTVGPILVVVDAVDESGDKYSRTQLLQIVMKHASTLPPNFRILITSRPEFDIEKQLGSSPFVLRKRMEAVPDTARDIRCYLQSELASDFCHLQDNGKWLDGLVDLSEELFQWAFTASRFIKGDGETVTDPVKQLDILLSQEASTKESGPLDNLYLEVLKQKFPQVDRVPFRAVMRIVLAAKQPLSITALKKLVIQSDGRYQHPVDLILLPLGSLLSGVGQSSSPVFPLHTSFRDFLLDEKRGDKFHVNLSGVDDDFAIYCFSAMRNGLRFNICDLETSYLANIQVSDLSSRIEQAIPQHLSYACRYWADHLRTSSLTPNLLDELMLFMKTQFLHWLETMSLVGAIPIAGAALQMLQEVSEKMDVDLANFVTDASRFVSTFSAPISRSAPHTYLSALPFAPTQSRISRQYICNFGGTLSVVTGKMEVWPVILNVLEGHTDWVTSVAFSPDGKRVVSGSGDRTIRNWDVGTGALVARPFEGHSSFVASVAFSHDGKRVASGSDDETVRIWDAETGDLVAAPFEGHSGRVASIAFSHDDKRVASGSHDESVRIWDAETGALVTTFEGHSAWVTSVAFSHNDKRVASGSHDWTVRIWDVETGDLVATPFEGHSGPVRSVAFSHNGERVASGSNDTTVRIWDAEMGDLVVPPFEGHSDTVRSIAFSHDSKRVASGSYDKTVRMWDAETGGLVTPPFKGHSNWVTSVAFSPDGKRVVSGSGDKTVQIWDAEMGDLVAPPFEGHSDFVTSVAFSHDGKRVASGSHDKTVRTWDVETGALVTTFEGHNTWVMAIAFSRDGKRVASGSRDQAVRIWDAETGDLVAPPFEGHSDWVTSVAFSRDGERVASGSGDKTVRIWDVETGDLVTTPFEGHSDSVTSVAFSHDGKRVASGSDDETVQIWDAKTGDLVAPPFEGHSDFVTSVAFSHDGERVASGSYDMTVRIWDVETGDLVTTLFEGHSGPVTSVVFSHDSNRVASGSHDKTVRIWDVETGALVTTFEGHDHWVTSVAFSHNDKRVTSGSGDKTVRIWDVETGALVTTPFEGHSDSFMSVDLSPDGQASTSGSRDCAVRVQDVPYDISPSTPTPPLRDDSKLEYGWVLGKEGELVIWVPPKQRLGLLRPSTLLIIGANVTKIDFTHFEHGDRWSKCRTSSDQ